MYCNGFFVFLQNLCFKTLYWPGFSWKQGGAAKPIFIKNAHKPLLKHNIYRKESLFFVRNCQNLKYTPFYIDIMP